MNSASKEETLPPYEPAQNNKYVFPFSWKCILTYLITFPMLYLCIRNVNLTAETTLARLQAETRITFLQEHVECVCKLLPSIGTTVSNEMRCPFEYNFSVPSYEGKPINKADLEQPCWAPYYPEGSLFYGSVDDYVCTHKPLYVDGWKVVSLWYHYFFYTIVVINLSLGCNMLVKSIRDF